MLTLSKIVVGRLSHSSEVNDDVSSHIVITIKIAKSEIKYRSLPPSSGVVLTRLSGQRAEILQSGTGKSSQVDGSGASNYHPCSPMVLFSCRRPIHATGL